MGFLGFRSERELENMRLVYHCRNLEHRIEKFLRDRQLYRSSVLYLFGTTEEPKDIRDTIPKYCNGIEKIINKYFKENPAERCKAKSAYLEELERIKKYRLERFIDNEIRKRFIRENRDNIFKVFDTDIQLSIETICYRIKAVYNCSEERAEEIFNDYRNNALLNECCTEYKLENIFAPDSPKDEFTLNEILNRKTTDMNENELTRDEWLKKHNKTLSV